jgi:hypothetical protein
MYYNYKISQSFHSFEMTQYLSCFQTEPLPMIDVIVNLAQTNIN